MRGLTLALIALTLASCTSKYNKGKQLFEAGNFEESAVQLNLVESRDSDYEAAQKLLDAIDSVNLFMQQERERLDSINAFIQKIKQDSIREFNRIQNLEQLKSDISAHIENLNNISELKNSSTNAMVMKMGLFVTINNKCEEALRTNEKELKASAKKCLQLLKRVQLREFPKMRDDYASDLFIKFMDYDIYVRCEGKGNKTLVMTGDYFALDYRINEVHDALYEKLREFRFEKVAYEWSRTYKDRTYRRVSSRDDSWLGMP